MRSVALTRYPVSTLTAAPAVPALERSPLLRSDCAFLMEQDNQAHNALSELASKALSQMRSDDGWHNLASIGSTMKYLDPSFTPLQYGFQKLREALESIPDIVEIRRDPDRHPPIYYGRSLTPIAATAPPAASLPPQRPRPQPARPPQQRDVIQPIMSFAYMRGADTWHQLADQALSEKWYFGDTPPNGFPFPILTNYLNFTFIRLQHERKVCYSPEPQKRAAFNTGLVDNRFEPIYAYFLPNHNQNQQPWVLSSFCIAGEGRDGKDIVRYLKAMPEPAHYFANAADMFYNIEAGEPQVDWEHILVDNVDRLPLAFVSEVGPKTFTAHDCSGMDRESLFNYKDDFQAALNNDKRAYRDLMRRLDGALDVALRRVRWNFKTAIPMYYPRRRQMSLLLPLGLISDETIDVALVVERTQSGNYLGHTILPLDWAYNNARLVCRPDSDWLTPQLIASAQRTDEEQHSADDNAHEDLQ
jgi:hypothetical protein